MTFFGSTKAIDLRLSAGLVREARVLSQRAGFAPPTASAVLVAVAVLGVNSLVIGLDSQASGGCLV